jgi:hypothetical protein
VAITFHFDEPSGIFIVTWTGEVSLEETKRHWQTMLNNPNLIWDSRILSDLSEATLGFTGGELWKTVDDYLRDPERPRSLKIAVIVSGESQEKIARALMAIMPKTFTMKLFYDRTSAISWLESGQDGLQTH